MEDESEPRRTPGSSISFRSSRDQHLHDDAAQVRSRKKSPSEGGIQDLSLDNTQEKESVNEVAQQVFALIQENHLHMASGIPPADELEALKDSAPEVYDLYLTSLERAIEDESYRARAEVDYPHRIVRRGQILGFFVVLASLIVVVCALYTNHPWIAGVLSAIDLVALAAVFASREKET